MLIASVFPYLAVFTVACVVTAVLIPAVIRAAVHHGIIDRPDARRIHDSVIPRAGGIAVFVGTLAASALIFTFPELSRGGQIVDLHWWGHFLLATLMVALVGFIDDLCNLKPVFKLAGQTTAAVILFLAGIRVQAILGVQLPVPLDLAITVGWLVFVTNAFNLIDGIDGLASGLAAIAGLGLVGSLIHRGLGFEALLVVSMIGSCVGFLRYNIHPARVFLGDCGSNFIGFFLAAMTLATGSKGTTLGYLWVPILALSIPFLDTMLAIWRRSTRVMLAYLQHQPRPKGVMSGDLEHLHHRLMKLGLSQRDVSACLYFASACLVLIGLITLPYQEHALGIGIVTLVVGGYILLRYVPMAELWESGTVILHALAHPKKPLVAFIIYASLDICGLVFAFLIALRVTHSDLPYSFVLEGGARTFLTWCGLPLAAIIIKETYTAVWAESVSRIMILLLLIGIATLSFTHEYLYLMRVFQAHTVFVRASLFLGFSFVFLMGTRIILEVIERVVCVRLKKEFAISYATLDDKSLALYSRIWESPEPEITQPEQHIVQVAAGVSSIPAR